MDSSISLKTSSFTLFTISKQHNRHLSCHSATRNPFTRRLTSFSSLINPSFSRSASSTLRPSSLIFPLSLHRLECVSKCTSSFPTLTSSPFRGDGESESFPEAIILDVGGMSSDGSAATIKRIPENHPKVYAASTNQMANTAIVWPESEAKDVPNWQEQLGDELALYLMNCGFESKLRDRETFRGCLKNTPYDIWDGYSVSSPLDSELISYGKEVESTKVKVKELLLASTKEFTKNIEFLNLLCRLGLSYHFEDEINENLHHIFTMLPELLENNDYNLCTIANLFRVSRLYGYNTTCDVFEKFKDGDGKFKNELGNDVNGILCLYEACFLAFPGEDILDQALTFTRNHLQVLAENSSNLQVQKYIRTALVFPSHWIPEIIDASYYISFYQEDESANETLLELAKSNFNWQQLLYKKELVLLSQWWIDTEFKEKFPYARVRFLEANFWSIGCISEPEYQFARLINTKHTVLMTVIDDTYDTYGSIEQLKLFTTALQRMTVDAGDELPKCMKNYYEILFQDLESNGTKGCSSFDDLEINGTKGFSYKSAYVAETMKKIARSYLIEANWKNERNAPSFDEYIKNGKVTSAFEIFAAVTILGIENMGVKEIQWLRNDSGIVDASKRICRLVNDLVGQTDAKERRDFPKAVDCFMKQYGVSEDEAIEAIQKIVNDNWKLINKEMLKPSSIPKILLKFTLNYARMTYVVNAEIDSYTYPTYLKEIVSSLLIDPLPM